ncbi:MAG TPA: hypothetical protein VHG91_17250 [Longimicrobium sp.]|nr:hypothetical protein [Longimicrobium sp.]
MPIALHRLRAAAGLAVPLVAAALAAAPLAAQEGRSAQKPTDRKAPSAPEAAEKGTKVSARDVYIACRFPNRLGEPSGRIETFCEETRVPRAGEDFVRADTLAWGRQGLPPAAELVAHRDTAEALARRHAWWAGDTGGARWSADADTLTAGQKRAIVRTLPALRARVEGGERVVVFGYPEPGDTSLDRATARAEAIRSFVVGEGVPEAGVVAQGRPFMDRPLVTVRQARALRALGGEREPGAAEPTPEGKAAPPVLGGTSALLVAATDALLEHANAQVQVHVTARVADRLCRDTGSYLRHTCVLFGPEARRHYFPTVGALRTAIREDLSLLPDNLAGQTLRFRLLSDADTLRREQTAIALYLLRYLRQVEGGADPLRALEGFPAWQDTLSKGQPKRIVSARLDALVEFATYIGNYHLAEQELKTIALGEPVSPETVALYTLRSMAVNGHSRERTDSDRLTAYRELLMAGRRAQEQKERVAVLLDSLKKAAQDTASAEQRIGIYTEILRQTGNVPLAILQHENPEFWNGIDGMFTPLSEMMANVRSRDYPRVLHNLVTLTGEILDDEAATRDPAWCQRMGQRWDKLSLRDTVLSDGRRVRREMREAPAELDRDRSEVTFACLLTPRQLRLLSFASDVSVAPDADAMRASFRNFLGQSGGFYGKREGRGMYVRLNAYLGGTVGDERLLARADSLRDRDAYRGLYLPVGVEVGVPLAQTRWPVFERHGFSLGGFVQLLDLGAIAARRLNEEDPAEEAVLEKVFTPGAFVVLGLGKLPFAVGVGASYVPAARDAAGEEVGSVRRMVFLGLDLPVFP